MRASRRSFAKAALGVAGTATLGTAACAEDAPAPFATTSAVPVSIPAQRERPASVLAIGAFVDLPSMHAALKDHHDTGLITGATWPSTAIALLALPLLFAQHVDDAAPVRVLLVGESTLVVAIALRNADLALATATSGSTAHWKRKLVGNVDVLERLDGEGLGVSASLGVCRNALLAVTSASFFEANADVALYAATPDADGFAALTDKPIPPRFGAVVPGRVLRQLLTRSMSKVEGAGSAIANALAAHALGPYDAAELPIGFTVDAGAATLDLSLPDRAEHLGLSPIPATSLFGLPSAAFAAAYGDLRGGPLDPSVIVLLGAAGETPEAKQLLAAFDRREGEPVSFTMSRAPTGTAFVLRAKVKNGEAMSETLKALASNEAPAEGADQRLRVRAVALTRIGIVHEVGLGEVRVAIAVKGDLVVLASAEEPLVALVAALESSAPFVADRLPRSLANRMPDPSLLSLALDLDSLRAPNERAREVGPGALVLSIFGGADRASVRCAISPAGWRALSPRGQLVK